MFDSLQRWLEGLFRPLITVEGNQDVINTQSTIWDVTPRKRMMYRQMLHNETPAGSTTAIVYTKLSARPCFVVRMTFTPSLNATVSWYGITDTNDPATATTEETGNRIGLTLNQPSVLTPEYPTYVPAGHSLNIATVAGFGAQRTGVVQIVYFEVD